MFFSILVLLLLVIVSHELSPEVKHHPSHYSPMYQNFAVTSNKVPDLLIENEYWDQVKANKIQNFIDLDDKREVNSPSDLNKYLKVVCISDTHSKLNDSHQLPDGDVLIVAGDITNYGSISEIGAFNHQIAKRPHKHKLVIAGNHDLGWDKGENLLARFERFKGMGTYDGGRLLEGVTYLEDEEIVIDGVKFYGTPWHPNPGYPFYADRNGGLATKWERIPNDTDVLITHTPPDIWICTQMRSIGVVGICWRGSKLWLRSEFLILFQQQYFIFHVFGHVHYCNGAVSNGITTFINAAQLRKGKVYENSPIVFYIEKNADIS